MFAAVDEREVILFLRINIQSQLKEVKLFLQQVMLFLRSNNRKREQCYYWNKANFVFVVRAGDNIQGKLYTRPMIKVVTSI